MENENEEIITPDEQTDEEVVEDVESEEETTEDETDEEPVETKPKLTREQKLAKAQAMVKRYSPKQEKETTQTDNNQNNPLSRDEAILYAQGMTVEDVEDAQFIADKDGTTLAEATSTSRFKALKKEREDETKNNAAQLKVSKGSKSPNKASLADSNLDEDTHKKLWKEKTGQ